MLVLPAPSYNQDHEAVYKAGMTACRPHLADMKAFQRTVLVADAPQLTWGGDGFRPSFYVDISGRFLDRKLKAYACHASQVRPEPSQAGLDALRILAEARGREISVEAAEAFACPRFVL
jgi:LmbE family N-acetylglucosaminyl deacetylase